MTSQVLVKRVRFASHSDPCPISSIKNWTCNHEKTWLPGHQLMNFTQFHPLPQQDLMAYLAYAVDSMGMKAGWTWKSWVNASAADCAKFPCVSWCLNCAGWLSTGYSFPVLVYARYSFRPAPCFSCLYIFSTSKLGWILFRSGKLPIATRTQTDRLTVGHQIKKVDFIEK